MGEGPSGSGREPTRPRTSSKSGKPDNPGRPDKPGKPGRPTKPGKPDVGPAGEILFFAWSSDGTEPTSQEDVFGVDSATGALRRITDDSSGVPFVSDRDPSWSPDRTQVVHVRNDDLVVSTAAAVQVATHAVPARRPVWIDAATIVGSVHRLGPGGTFDRADLVTVDVATGSQTALTSVAAGEWLGAPAWHPTGGMAANLERQDPVTSAHLSSGLVHLDAVAVGAVRAGGPPVPIAAFTALTTGTDWDTDPDWSPDGTTLAFSTLRPCATLSSDGTPVRQSEIALLDPLQPASETLVTDDAAGDYADGLNDGSPSYSPDGTWLAWVRGHEDDWTHVVLQRPDDPATRHTVLGGTSWFRHGLDW